MDAVEGAFVVATAALLAVDVVAFVVVVFEVLVGFLVDDVVGVVDVDVVLMSLEH